MSSKVQNNLLKIIATRVLIASVILSLLISWNHNKERLRNISKLLVNNISIRLSLPTPTLANKQFIDSFESTVSPYFAIWNKCKNFADGYSIKYPLSFYLSPSNQKECRTFILNEKDSHIYAAIELFLFNNPKRLAFFEWLRDPAILNKGILKPVGKEIDFSIKQIGNNEWLIFTGQEKLAFPPSGHIYWATLYKDKVMLVGLINLDIKRYKLIVEQIISTIQFE